MVLAANPTRSADLSVDKKVKKEVSTTGAVAGYHGRLSATGNPTKKELALRKKQKRKLLKMKKKNDVKETISKMVKESIKKVVSEQSPQEEKMSYVLRLFEGISKNLNVSLGYTRMFIMDALKMDDLTGGSQLNAKRAVAELSHIRKMIDDLESLIEQIYATNKKQQREQENA